MDELIALLVKQLNIREDQAKGGAALLFQAAQHKLGGDFSKVTQALPWATDLIQTAPQTGVTGAGGLADFAALVSGFNRLQMSPGIIMQFVQVIARFVENKGGKEIVEFVTAAFRK
jgi:hypothetical protein